MIQTIDVQAIGANGTEIGFAALNTWFHGLTGASMVLSIALVLLLAMTREAYAVVAAFLLLVIKGILLLKYSKG